MRNSIPLFRLFGIEVGLDYSWFLVFLLVIWSLTGHYLMVYQGWSTGFRLLLAVITAVLFFASVLAHEFGHSLVAIRTGVPVRRITLFIFGGVAQLTREPRRAPDEFLIAVAGPVVSLLLAGGFGALWLLGRFLGLQPATVVAGWLGGINLMLALFNLIPGFPLYGVLERMTASDVNQMPVMDNGQLLGMVARDRVLAFIRTRAELGMGVSAQG